MSDADKKYGMDPYKFEEGEFIVSEQDKQAAKAHARRAGRQSRHAARNMTKASRLAATPVVDAVEEGAEKTADVAQHISPRGLAAISGDTGTGFLALSVALYAAAIAFSKFGSAYKGRDRAIQPTVNVPPPTS